MAHRQGDSIPGQSSEDFRSGGEHSRPLTPQIPIVVDKAGVIVVGHVRYLAARKLGLNFVPVHVAENLTPAQIRAYRLMDNRSHEETAWDSDLLTLEMVELKALDFELLDFTGFTPRQIDELLVAEGGDHCPPRPRIQSRLSATCGSVMGIGFCVAMQPTLILLIVCWQEHRHS